MGVDLMHEQLSPFAFGRKTGIDLDGEVTGVLPSTEWKKRAYKRPEQQRWYAGETISLGIGQGYNNFTMLQIAHAMEDVFVAARAGELRVHRAIIDAELACVDLLRQLAACDEPAAKAFAETVDVDGDAASADCTRLALLPAALRTDAADAHLHRTGPWFVVPRRPHGQDESTTADRRLRRGGRHHQQDRQNRQHPPEQKGPHVSAWPIPT